MKSVEPSTKSKLPFVSIAIILFVSVGFYASFKGYEQTTTKKPTNTLGLSDKSYTTFRIGKEEMFLERSVTIAEREKGLSGRSGLGSQDGMLFVFDTPSIYGFWMKDMKFPIDIIWLNSKKEIVYIKADAKPGSYPESYQPKDPALYVIEVNAGKAQQLGLYIGQTLKF